MSEDLDFDDELIWESYSQEEQTPVEDIKYYLSDGYGVDEIAEEFGVDENTVRDIQKQMFDPDEGDDPETEHLLKKFKLDKEDVAYKSTSMAEGIPTDKVNPKGGDEEWYADRNTAGVPEVKPQRKRGKKIR